MASLSLRFVARTDTGLRRSSNQDSGYASARLIAIADGMGGAAAGDLASATTMNIVRSLDRENTDDPRTALLQAVRDANRRLGEISTVDPSVDGMGTTLEAMLWTGEQFVTAHIGDSRSYRLRDGELTQLSHDHTFVQSLVDEGKISAAEARVHPHRSLLLRVLLGRADNEPDMGELEGQAGDRYLLCSDGLTDMVDDATIGEALALEDLEAAADRLIELALAGGGLDNVTVVIGELVDEAPEPAEPQLVGAAAERPRRRPAAVETTATIAPPPDVEELRYSYVPPPRMSWLRYGLVIGVGLLVLLAGSVALYRASQTQYFVGVSNDHVAIYRGVDADLPFIPLNSVAQETDIPLSALTSVNRDLVVDGIEARDRADADATVARLRAARIKPQPKPTPTPSATPADGTTTPTPTPTTPATP